ncbi:MAG TPA: hypothetical protein VOA87_21585 [Thermoanaerobaculia bacterium]|nr:hypothetical protein [Thermoanaerobaculia bacterium]
MSKARRHTLWCIGVLAFVALPGALLALPATPRRFVDNLDERCYQILAPQQALNLPLNLTFLDPLLVKKGLQAGSVVLQDPQKLCVPVKKDGVAPPPDTLPFISALDWKCYGIKGKSLNLALKLTQLNQVIAKVLGPGVAVTVGAPQQLCVPVVKNNLVPKPVVQHLVQFLDVECFGVESQQQIAGKPITLAHLNPMFTGRPPENLQFLTPGPTQLCVPVAKDGQTPPPDVLPYIQFSDVLCYPMGGINLDSLLTLTQLDPVMLAHKVPAEKVSVGVSRTLCVPVAKDGELPPGAP